MNVNVSDTNTYHYTTKLIAMADHNRLDHNQRTPVTMNVNVSDTNTYHYTTKLIAMADHNRLDHNQRTPVTADIFAISKYESLKPNTSLPLLTPPSLCCKRKCVRHTNFIAVRISKTLLRSFFCLALLT